MNLLSMLLTTGGNWDLIGTVGYMLVFVVIIYFIAIRPQKKQQKKQLSLLDTLEAGDSVITSSGFYGVVIDVQDHVVIVEFGNNKNCRIPMKKEAVIDVEKPGQAEE